MVKTSAMDAMESRLTAKEMLDLMGEGALKKRIAQMSHANKLTLALRFGCAEVALKELDAVLVARICDAAAEGDSSKDSEADKDKDIELHQLRTMVVHLQDQLEVVSTENRKMSRELDHYRREILPAMTFMQHDTEPPLAAEEIRQTQREEAKISSLYRAFKFLSGSYQTTSTEHADRAAAHNLERQRLASRPATGVPIWDLQQTEDQAFRRTNDWVISQARSLDYRKAPQDYEEAIKDLESPSGPSQEAIKGKEVEKRSASIRGHRKSGSDHNSKNGKDLEDFINEAPKIQYRENPVNKVARAAWKTSAFASSVPASADILSASNGYDHPDHWFREAWIVQHLIHTMFRYSGLIGQMLGTSPPSAKGRETTKIAEFED